VATATQILTDAPFFLQKDSGEAQPIYYSAADFRRYTAAIQRRSGILGSSAFLVTQADNVGWSIKVNSGHCNVGGEYIVSLGTDVTIRLDTAGFNTNPTAPRTHKVWIAIQDGLFTGNDYDARIVITEDTGSGAPTPPNVSKSIQIASVVIAASQSNIQNSHIINSARHGGTGAEHLYLEPYLASGIAAAGATDGAHDPRAQYDNGRVHLSGAVKQANGAHFLAGQTTTLGVMHSNLRPARKQYLVGATSLSDTGTTGGIPSWRLQIDPAGTMTAYINYLSAPNSLLFDGMTYDLD
jgi:hypothetical protein